MYIPTKNPEFAQQTNGNNLWPMNFVMFSGKVWTLCNIQGIFMLCFTYGMTMIFVSLDIGVHEKLHVTGFGVSFRYYHLKFFPIRS
jgi:hypothetical protein